MSDIGILIRRHRERRGLSQTALANICGMVQSSISSIENGDTEPSDENLICIAKALNAPDIITESCSSCSKRNHILKQYGRGMKVRKHTQLSILAEYISDIVSQITEKVDYVESLKSSSDLFMKKWTELYDLELRLEVLVSIMKRITETTHRDIIETDNREKPVSQTDSW
jgi:transcriptional regulator with XRE-family HTH domain